MHFKYSFVAKERQKKISICSFTSQILPKVGTGTDQCQENGLQSMTLSRARDKEQVRESWIFTMNVAASGGAFTPAAVSFHVQRTYLNALLTSNL